MGSSFKHGAPVAPAPLKTQQQRKNCDMMMISDMLLKKKMMIREMLTKKVRNLPRKQKQHRDLQRREVRKEPFGGARCSGLRRRRGLQGFWQRGSPGSGSPPPPPPPFPPADGARAFGWTGGSG